MGLKIFYKERVYEYRRANRWVICRAESATRYESILYAW